MLHRAYGSNYRFNCDEQGQSAIEGTPTQKER
jgi:hypothetical protein